MASSEHTGSFILTFAGIRNARESLTFRRFKNLRKVLQLTHAPIKTAPLLSLPYNLYPPAFGGNGLAVVEIRNIASSKHIVVIPAQAGIQSFYKTGLPLSRE